MTLSAKEFCHGAVAYLKTALPADNGASVKLAIPDTPVLKNLGNGLAVAYIVDEGDHFNYVQNRHLAAAGLTESDLHSIAVENLKHLCHDKARVQPYGPVFAVFMGGNFEASLLLVDSFWNDNKNLVSNSFIAAIPARDILAFSDSESSEGLQELRSIIGRLENGDHFISARLFRRKGSEWVSYAE